MGKFSAVQGYFGRWLLFVAFGIAQSLIVCLGDLYLLDIQCANPAAFLFAGVFASFVYVNIIYALSITFKHIGKAVCVILVIVQIPGSAGTYPIEMTPGFFQALHPLLPFTYGINAMREAVAGIYRYHYLKDMLCLTAFIPIALLIGVAVRPWMLNLNLLFDKKLAQTDLMLCEENGMPNERMRLSSVVRMLAGQEEFQEQLREKAAGFERRYERRIKRGFLAILVIPLIFLLLMFSIDSKMIFLVLWIASIIGIALYLICLEYIHESLNRQMRLSKMSREELHQVLKNKKEDSGR
ncbi:MAG: YhgE/Pip family protein [Blautia marasmi]